MTAETGKITPSGVETTHGQGMVNEKAVETSVPILEGMDEDEAESQESTYECDSRATVSRPNRSISSM
jgi:hypothetical protein